MHQGLEHQMPSFDLPSKILCKVASVQRRVSYSYSFVLFYFFTVTALCPCAK